MNNMTRSPSPTKSQEDVAPQNSSAKSPCTPLMQREDGVHYSPLPELAATDSSLQTISSFNLNSPVSPKTARPHAPSPRAETRSPTPEEDREVREAEKKLAEVKK